MTKPRYVVQWDEQPVHLCKMMCSLMESQILVDLTIICNSYSIRVHKCVLAANSSYFRERLQKDMSIDKVVMNGLKHSVLKALIEFIYCGETSVSEENIRELVSAAKFFCIRGITSIVPEKLGIENADEQPFALINKPPVFFSKTEKSKYCVKDKDQNFAEKDVKVMVETPDYSFFDSSKRSRLGSVKVTDEDVALAKEEAASRFALEMLQKDINNTSNVFVIDETCTEATVETNLSAQYSDSGNIMQIQEYVLRNEIPAVKDTPTDLSKSSETGNSANSNMMQMKEVDIKNSAPEVAECQPRISETFSLQNGLPVLYKDGNFLDVGNQILDGLSTSHAITYHVVPEGNVDFQQYICNNYSGFAQNSSFSHSSNLSQNSVFNQNSAVSQSSSFMHSSTFSQGSSFAPNSNFAHQNSAQIDNCYGLVKEDNSDRKPLTFTQIVADTVCPEYAPGLEPFSETSQIDNSLSGDPEDQSNELLNDTIPKYEASVSKCVADNDSSSKFINDTTSDFVTDPDLRCINDPGSKYINDPVPKYINNPTSAYTNDSASINELIPKCNIEPISGSDHEGALNCTNDSFVKHMKDSASKYSNEADLKYIHDSTSKYIDDPVTKYINDPTPKYIIESIVKGINDSASKHITDTSPKSIPISNISMPASKMGGSPFGYTISYETINQLDSIPGISGLEPPKRKRGRPPKRKLSDRLDTKINFVLEKENLKLGDDEKSGLDLSNEESKDSVINTEKIYEKENKKSEDVDFSLDLSLGGRNNENILGVSENRRQTRSSTKQYSQ